MSNKYNQTNWLDFNFDRKSDNRGSNLFPCDFLQSLILQIALNWLEQEKKETEAAKEAYMAQQCPSPDLSGDQTALMVRGKKR